MKAPPCLLFVAMMFAGCTPFLNDGRGPYVPALPQPATYWLHKTQLNILNGYLAWDDEDRGIHFKKSVRAGVVIDDTENLRPIKNGRIECADSDLQELTIFTYKDGKLADDMVHSYPLSNKSDDPLSLSGVLRCRNAGFPDLRRDTSAQVEVRVLAFVGEDVGGYVLRKTAAGTQAYRLNPVDAKTRGPKALAIGQKPKEPWDEIWKELKANDVLTLPDGMKLKNSELILDGIWFIVETKEAGRFRRYTYDNPEMQKGPEAKKVVRINQICEESLEDQ